MTWRVPCTACRGRKTRYLRVIACDQIPQSTCDHFSHFGARLCGWCRGTGRVDRITAVLQRTLDR